MSICLLAVMVVMLMVGPTAIVASPGLISQPPVHAVVSQSTSTTATRDHLVPLESQGPSRLPPSSFGIGTCANAGAGPVVPNCAYPVEAAPMGIGDFGVSGTNYYAYNTTRFLGVFAYNKLDIYNNSIAGGYARYFTVQLNVVLNFINGGQNYSYWIQDVAVPEDIAQNDVTMSYEDNIWNFSSTAPGTLTGLKGNGTVSGTGLNSYYYAGATGTGSGDVLNAPNSFELLVNSSMSVHGQPVVDFQYKDPTMTAFRGYDIVTFTNYKAISLDRGFFVDGFDMNPLGLFEDAELTIGGPGGGTYTITQATTEATEELYFWNGHNYQAPRSTWNFGSDTAESTSSDQSIFGNDGSGTPLTVQLNGTTRDAKPGEAYAEAQVGTLQINSPTIPAGKVEVAAMACMSTLPLSCTNNYIGGEAMLTLIPGTYHVWDNYSATSIDLGMCTITAGATLSITLPGSCAPLTAVAVDPSVANIAPGNNRAFTENLTCAEPSCPLGATYSWTLTNGAMGTLTGATSSSVTFTAGTTLAGTVGLFLNVTLNGVTLESHSIITIPAVLTSVTVNPTSATVNTDGSQSFTATAVCNGVCAAGTAYSWTLTNVAMGSLTGSTTSNPSFTAGTTGGTVGLFVNATLNGVTKQSTVTVITIIALTSVTVAPTSATVGTGGTQGFTATPVCSGTCGSGATFAWTLTNGAMGSLTNPTTATPTFNAGMTGGTVGLFVNTTLNGVTKQSSATVITVIALSSVSVSPTSATVNTDGSQGFTATLVCNGTCGTGATYTWALTNGAMGSLTNPTTASPSFTAGTTGGTVGLFVNATLNGIVKQSTVTVITIIALSSVSVSPTSSTLNTGGSQGFSATLTCNGTCGSGTTYSWTLTNGAMGSLTNPTTSTPSFTAGNTGGTVGLFVNATLNGVVKQSSVTVITIIALSSVAISPNSASIPAGETQPLTATPTCTSTCPAGTTYSWTITNGAMGSITGSGSAVTFNAGSTLGKVGVFVNATLNGVVKQSLPTIITITSAILLVVSVSPATAVVVETNSAPFTAIPVCSITSCPPGTSYTWSLTNGAMGSLNVSTGSVVGFTAGSTAGTVGLFVNATLTGITRVNSAEITITPLTLNSVAISPTLPTVSSSSSTPFTATPTCSTTCPSTGIVYTWALTSSLLGSLSGSGATVNFNAGTTAGTVGIYVNATYGATTKEASTVITVTVPLNSVAISPLAPTVSTGSTTPFTATPTCGGTCPGSITYVWALTSSTLGSLSGSGATVNFVAVSATGTVGIYVNATLGATTKESSTVITVIVSLTSVSLSPLTPTVSTLGSQAFTAIPTCSSACPGGISYSWTLTSSALGSLTGSGSSVTFNALSTAGTVGIYVNATLGTTTKGASTVITLVVSLTSVSLSPLAPTVPTGGSQPFAATPTCSTTCPGTIVYAWALTSATLGSLTGTGYSVTFNAGSASGTVGIFVNATLGGVTKESSTLITVAVALTGLTLSPTTPTVSTAGSQPFTASPICSSTCPGGITYAWSLTSGSLGSLSGSGATVTFNSASSVGTVGIFVNATMSGRTEESSTVITVVVTLSSVSLSPTTPTLSTGGSQAFTATPICSSNCPGGISYSWTLTSSTVGSVTGSGASVTFNAGSAVGTVGIYVNATLGGVTMEASTVITVEITLNSVAVTPTAPTVPTGGTQPFVATPTCSSACPGGITYVWALTKVSMGSITGSGPSVSFIAGTTSGTVGIYVNATLSGVTKESSTVITITVSTITLVSVALSPASPTVGFGGAQAITATATCTATCPGSGISYSWSLTNAVMGSLTGSGYQVTFKAGTTAGTVGLFVNATLNGVTVHGAPAIITIVSTPTGPIISSFSASVDPVVVGHPTNLTVSASGGVGVLKYAYTGLPPGCASSNLTVIMCVPSVTGTFTIRVFANDSVGHSATSITSLEVEPTPYTVTFTESGLPSGTSWSVTLNGTANTSTSTTITFSEPNGPYSYSVGTPISIGKWKQYVGSPSSGELTVSGGPTGASIAFTEQFQLTMSSSSHGSVSPSTGWHGAGSIIELTATPASGYVFSTWTGSGPGAYSGGSNPFNLTLSGSDNETAIMVAQNYSVTFTESGLPSGTSWYVSLNGTATYSTSTTIVLMLVNGDYTYTVKPMVTVGSGTEYEASPSEGNLTVAGTALSEPVVYGAMFYLTVSISPAGAGTVSQASGWISSGAKVSLQAVPSSGYYFVGWTGSSSPGYSGPNNPASLTMTAPISEEAVFDTSPCWIAGSVSPTGATLLIDGISITIATNGTFNATVASGTHSIVVSDTGYQTQSFNVSLKAGTGVKEVIALKPVTNGGNTGTSQLFGGGFPLLLIVIVAIIAVALLVFVVAWRRRENKKGPGNTVQVSQVSNEEPSLNQPESDLGPDVAPAAVAYYTAPGAQAPETPSDPNEPLPEYSEDDA